MERPAFETLGRADGTGGAGKDTDVRCHLCQLVPARPAPALLFIVPRTALSQTPASVPACEGGRGRGVGTRDRNNVQLPARGRSAPLSACTWVRNAPRDPSGGRAGVGWRRASIIECELPRDAPPPARSSVLATEPPRNSRPFPPYPVTSRSCPLSRGRHADRLPHRSRAAQAGLPALLLIRCTTPGGPQPLCTLVSSKTEVAIITLPLQRTLVRIK